MGDRGYSIGLEGNSKERCSTPQGVCQVKLQITPKNH